MPSSVATADLPSMLGQSSLKRNHLVALALLPLLNAVALAEDPLHHRDHRSAVSFAALLQD